MKISKLVNAIKAKCLDCSGHKQEDVLHCPIKDCPLYPYRMGGDQHSLLGDDDRHGADAELGGENGLSG